MAPPRLTVIGGNDRGREFTLEPHDTRIGRGTDNDIILTDINLPGLNGLDLIRALRTTPTTRDAAIFVLSSDGTQELARVAGADDYIVKPIDPQPLVDRIRAVLDCASMR